MRTRNTGKVKYARVTPSLFLSLSVIQEPEAEDEEDNDDDEDLTQAAKTATRRDPYSHCQVLRSATLPVYPDI